MVMGIFAVQMLFFCSTNDIFWVCSKKFLVCRKFFFEFYRLMERVLSPNGTCFAALC